MAALSQTVRSISPGFLFRRVLIFLLHIDPADDVFREALQGYAKENGGSGLSTDDQLLRLQKQFGLSIKCVDVGQGTCGLD